MALTDRSVRRVLEVPYEAAESGATDAGGLQALEAEVRMMRTEFLRLRELIADREQKGRSLINAYRDVVAELANLFEAERKENIKREESLRFFLGSIEKRLKEDIRNELRGPRPDASVPAGRRRFWSFRRR